MLNKTLKKTLISVFFIACSSSLQAKLPDSCPTLAQLEHSKVQSDTLDWLPDGDTIYTKEDKKLRLLNINTPEINPTSNKPAEPFSRAAKERLIELIGSSKIIYWISDQRKKDKYKRELALVFNSNGVFLNGQLVADGFAHTLLIPPNQKYWQCIVDAEKIARQKNKKIWSVSEFKAKKAKQVKAHQGFQLVSGKITEIKETKKNRWLVLDNYLWVGIARKDFQYFKTSLLNFRVGQIVTLRGYAYHSHKKLRMKLRHPAMLLE